MFTPKDGKVSRIVFLCLSMLLSGGLVAVYEFSSRPPLIATAPVIPDSPAPVPLPKTPTCRIRFLTREERLTEPVLKPRPNSYTMPQPNLPQEEVENPVLYPNRYARIRFENHTAHDLAFYTHVSCLDDYEECWSIKLPTARPITGIPRLVSSGFLVKEEVHDEKGNLLTGDYSPEDSLQSLGPPHLPTAGDLASDRYTTVALRADEGIDLNMSILGRVVRPERGLKPGLYTVRAILSYAEAPNGEAKHIASEPVTVRVTEENIKAAEAFWASCRH
jgi:hypothetical protein